MEILLVVLLLVAFFLVAYKGAVHEFQILQKDWAPNIDWSSLLGEQLPLVIRAFKEGKAKNPKYRLSDVMKDAKKM